MKRAIVFAAIICSIFTVFALPVGRQASAQVSPDIIENAKPAIVAIYGDEATQYVRGTGFIFDDKGYILTNYHVCSDCPRLWVRLYDDRIFEAVRIYFWKFEDMAILRLVPELSNDRRPFPYLNLNDTTWIVSGSTVAAIGHSKYGLWQIIQGHIKNKNYFIRYQPTILYGFSGSPLINTSGRVVGLNVGSDGRDVSINKDGFYSSAITLNDIQKFLNYFYRTKFVITLRPSTNHPKHCIWIELQNGRWCRQ